MNWSFSDLVTILGVEDFFQGLERFRMLVGGHFAEIDHLPLNGGKILDAVETQERPIRLARLNPLYS